MRKYLITAAAAMTAMFGAASANVITIAGNNGTITCTDPDAPVTEPACAAFTLGAPALGAEPNAIGVLSTTDAWYYDGTPSNPTDERNRISILLTGSPGNYTESGTKDETSPPSMFTTTAEYIVLKLGNESVFIANLTGGLLTINISGLTSSFGLSHVSEYGVVPVPGAIWLMMAGLAGLGFSTRKKKVA